VVIGPLAFIAIVGVLLWFFLRKKKKTPPQQYPGPEQMAQHGPMGPQDPRFSVVAPMSPAPQYSNYPPQMGSPPPQWNQGSPPPMLTPTAGGEYPPDKIGYAQMSPTMGQQPWGQDGKAPMATANEMGIAPVQAPMYQTPQGAPAPAQMPAQGPPAGKPMDLHPPEQRAAAELHA